MTKDLPVEQAIGHLARMLEDEAKIALTEKQISDYQASPIKFCEEILGVTFWTGQKEILESVRDNERTTVRSCNSAGKTFAAACVVLWFLKMFKPSTVVTTAPTNRQVKDILWKEIASVYHHAKESFGGKLLTTHLNMSNTQKWFATGFMTKDYSVERFQGFHNENILIIVDEASGVERLIFEGIEGLMASGNAKLLLIGNPIEKNTVFGDSFRPISLYNRMHISAFDTPNLKAGKTIFPYLITKEWVESRKKEWGEDSALYQVRVLGNFPDQSDDTLISLSWIESAIDRDIEDTGEKVVGMDVARFGDDHTVIIVRNGNKVVQTFEWQKQDTMYSSGRLAFTMRDYSIDVANVDEGLGAGIIDRLKEQGLNVKGINFGSRADKNNTFLNLRSEMYWNLRELFQKGIISIPYDELLMDELSKIKYVYTSNGKIKIEDKDIIKGRIGRSPDRADALALAFLNPVSSTSVLGSVNSIISKENKESGIIERIMSKIGRSEADFFCSWCGKKSCIIVESSIYRCLICGRDFDEQGKAINEKGTLSKAFDLLGGIR